MHNICKASVWSTSSILTGDGGNCPEVVHGFNLTGNWVPGCRNNLSTHALLIYYHSTAVFLVLVGHNLLMNILNNE